MADHVAESARWTPDSDHWGGRAMAASMDLGQFALGRTLSQRPLQLLLAAADLQERGRFPCRQFAFKPGVAGKAHWHS